MRLPTEDPDDEVVIVSNSNHPLSLFNNNNNNHDHQRPSITNDDNDFHHQNAGTSTTTSMININNKEQNSESSPSSTAVEAIVLEVEQADEDDLPTLEDVEPGFETSLLYPCHFPENHTFLSVSSALRRQAISASLTHAVGFLGTSIALSAVGRNHSTQTLASCGIGISAFNVLSLSISVGWASAVDTLASNAFGRLQKGRGRIEEVGEITQVALGTAMVLCILTGLTVFLFAAPIVRVVFGEIYVEGASEFLHNAFPYLIFFTICGVLFKSLQAQHLASVTTHASFCGLLAIFVFSLFLIPEFGVKGVAWSLGLSNLVQIFACLKLAPEKTTLFFKVPWFRGVTKDYFFNQVFTKERVWEYTAVAIPTIFSVSAEWCVFELLYVVLIHSGAKEREVAAFSIFFNIAVLCWTIGSGTAVACYSFVGKLLGESKGQLALVLGRTSIFWSWLIALVCAATVCVFHNLIFSLYTKDKELIEELRGILILFVLYHQGDNLQYSLQAMYRGAGKQDQTVKPVLLSLWAIALPAAFLSTHFISATLHSLLLGFILGFVFEIPFLARKILQWDWNELAIEASREKEHQQEAEEINIQQKEEQQKEHATEEDVDMDLVVAEESRQEIVDGNSVE